MSPCSVFRRYGGADSMRSWVAGARPRDDCRLTVSPAPCAQTPMVHAAAARQPHETQACLAYAWRLRTGRSRKHQRKGERSGREQSRRERLLRTRLRTRRWTRLRLRWRAPARGQLDIRCNDDRDRRIRRQFGRCRNRLRLDDRLPRKRRGLEYGSALTVTDAVLRVENHRLARAGRCSGSARHGKNWCQRSCKGQDQDGWERADE